MAALDEDEYEIPLRDQRYFGAGIKRKRIQFVQSSSQQPAVKSSQATPSRSAADEYLSIVFGKSAPTDDLISTPLLDEDGVGRRDDALSTEENEEVARTAEPTCDICNRQITKDDSAAVHESSIAHQICLQHSHPPSHLDRKRKGLAVLESQGWDPDGRKGLGVTGGGILYPVKAKENPKGAGLGVDLSEQPVVSQRVQKLDAGKVRSLEMEGKKRAAKLRDAFYRTDDVEKYLGAEGGANVNLDLDAFKRSKRRR